MCVIVVGGTTALCTVTNPLIIINRNYRTKLYQPACVLIKLAVVFVLLCFLVDVVTSQHNPLECRPVI